MLEFKIIQELEPNEELLENIKNYNYTIKNGKIKHLKATNLQFIKPTEYLIKYPTTLTILEYKVNEVSNKNFYIKEYNKKYNLKEIKQEEKNYQNHGLILLSQIIKMNFMKQFQKKYLIVEEYLLMEKIKCM